MPPSKRAAVPGDVFGPKRGALDKLTGRDATPQNGDTVLPQNGDTVSPQNSATDAKAGTEKVTFYLRPDQLDKLEDLARAYRTQTGKRIGRNELVRLLVDRCTLDLLVED